jgi:hypothetical protein
LPNGLKKNSIRLPSGSGRFTASPQHRSIGDANGRREWKAATFRRAISCSCGASSTPITRRKPHSAASTSARPLPEPKSTQVKPPGAMAAARMMARKIAGCTPS